MSLLDFNNFIGEGGIYGGELTNLSIKALQRARKTRAYQILEFIFRAGPNGTRYTDIVKFIVEELNGDKYDHSIHRGWYSDALNGMGKPALLQLYCKKLENGRWVLNTETTNFFKSEDALYKNLSQKELDLFNKLIK